MVDSLDEVLINEKILLCEVLDIGRVHNGFIVVFSDDIEIIPERGSVLLTWREEVYAYEDARLSLVVSDTTHEGILHISVGE